MESAPVKQQRYPIMTAPTPPKKKKKPLSCAAFSCLGCLGVTVLCILNLVVFLAIIDACTDHSEKLISSSTDYAAFTKKSKITFGPNVVSCEWALKGRNNVRLLSLSALVPSPSDYDVIISGFVVLPEEESKRILAEYEWNPAPQDDSANAVAKGSTGSGKTIPITLTNEFGTSTSTLMFDQNDYYDYLWNELRYMIDVMGLKGRTLLYSGSFEGMIQQQGSPYAITILFDPAHSTIFFHMTHM